jgi:hypothetical protein
MAMALLRRLLAVLVLVGVPLGSLWVLFGDYIPATKRVPREAGAEETPYLVYVQGMERYRDVYVRDGDSEDRARARLGRLPFDLPSASACLSEPLEAEAEPSTQSLAWERIGSLRALDVCLTRVLNRFNDERQAIAWLERQGFTLSDLFSTTACQGQDFNAYWSASRSGGPEAVWKSLSWLDRIMSTGIAVSGSVCRDTGEWYNFWLTGEPPPYFRARANLSTKWPK